MKNWKFLLFRMNLKICKNGNGRQVLIRFLLFSVLFFFLVERKCPNKVYGMEFKKFIVNTPQKLNGT